MTPTYIYGLYCPLKGNLQYIGITNNPPTRYSEHLYDKSNSKKVMWINGLRSHGLKPVMGIIEECVDGEARNRERFWINYYLNKGISLLNVETCTEQKTVQSVARYYISHLALKRPISTTAKVSKKQYVDNRPSPKSQKVIDFFKQNPERINESCLTLQSDIGVGKSTINAIQSAIRNGELELNEMVSQ